MKTTDTKPAAARRPTATLRWGAVVVTALTVTGYAQATHKSWVRADGGATCFEQGANASSPLMMLDTGAWNISDSIVSIVCPIKLGGAFQDPARTIPLHKKVPSMRVQVHYVDGTTDGGHGLACSVTALTHTGARSTTPIMVSCGTSGGCSSSDINNFAGSGFLEFADHNNIANRRIGVPNANTLSDVRSYTVSCMLSYSGDQGSSGVTGILTQTCQRDPSVSGFVCYD